MQHPEEGVIHTWLDGELPAEEAAALEDHIAECTDCAATVAEARGLIAASSRIVSALDIVPGDVIPRATPRKRAWYANTQLRAAAAVIVVAGASLIVMKRGSETDIRQVMDRTASAPAAALSDTSRAEKASQAIPGVAAEFPSPRRKLASGGLEKPAPLTAVPDAAKKRAVVRNESDMSLKATAADDGVRPTSALKEKALEGKASRAQVAVAAPPAASAGPAEQRVTPLQRVNPQTLLEKVIDTPASVSISPANADEAVLRQVKSDTTSSMMTSVYEVSPGVQVTLIEYSTMLKGGISRAREGAISDTMTRANRTLAAPQAALRTLPAESISWTNPSTGRAYTLAGPFSKEVLTALKGRLPPGKQ